MSINLDRMQAVNINFLVNCRTFAGYLAVLVAFVFSQAVTAYADDSASQITKNQKNDLVSYDKLWKRSRFIPAKELIDAPNDSPPEWSLQFYLGGVVEFEGRISAFLVHRVTGEVQQIILGYDDPHGLRLKWVEDTGNPFSMAVAVEWAGQTARITALQDAPQLQPDSLAKPLVANPPTVSPTETQPLADDPWPLNSVPSRYGKSPLPSDK